MRVAEVDSARTAAYPGRVEQSGAQPPAHRTSCGRQLAVPLLLLLACGPPSETTTATTGTADTTSASGTSAATPSGTPPTVATGEGSTSETSLLPVGCGDGVPQADVACYTRVVFPNIRGGARAPGDFNGDGATDLALVDDDVVRIVLGDGKGALTLAAEVPLGEPTLSDGTLHAADIDGDADVDLQVAIGDRLFTLVNDGVGQFKPQQSPLQLVLFDAVFVDTNMDAIPDLVVNTADNPAQALRIRPGPDFALAPYAGMIVGCYASALARIDFNQDTFDDVLVSSSCNNPPTNSPVHVFLGTGQTTFADGIQTVVGSEPIAFAVSDFDGDQREDFATANQFGDDISLVLRTADGFADEKRIGKLCPTCGNLLAISAGDIDGSGVADEVVAAVSTGSAVSLYLLMNPVEGPPFHTIALDEDTTRVFAVGDWNGDGIADIAAATPDGDLALVLFLSTP